MEPQKLCQLGDAMWCGFTNVDQLARSIESVIDERSVPSPIRHRLWKFLTPLNARHMNFAWASLFVVALTDVYVRLVASGAIRDIRLF